MIKYHGVLKQVNHGMPQFNAIVYHVIPWYIFKKTFTPVHDYA